GDADVFLVSTPSDSDEPVIQANRQGVTSFKVTNARRSGGDRLTILGHGGDDRVSGADVRQDLAAMEFYGETGSDTLIGTPYNDLLDSGLGTDTVTGGAGTDTFLDAGGVDTLVEYQDVDMSLFNNYFFAGKIVGDSGGTFFKADPVADQGQVVKAEWPAPVETVLTDTGDHYAATYTDPFRNEVVPVQVESLLDGSSPIFERAYLTGKTVTPDLVEHSRNNVLVVGDSDGWIHIQGLPDVAVDNWTQRVSDGSYTVRLDNVGNDGIGSDGLSEYYIVSFTGTGGARIYIQDTGGTSGYDELYIVGTEGKDFIKLDAGDKSTDLTAGQIVFGEGS
ncbi:MAG: hypothetical protein Q8N53_05880, partial [Longimicrobiales bacterium]|nr:hypothetical protein [Longimicrobiales bacterium]